METKMTSMKPGMIQLNAGNTPILQETSPIVYKEVEKKYVIIIKSKEFCPKQYFWMQRNQITFNLEVVMAIFLTNLPLALKFVQLFATIHVICCEER